MTETVHDLAGVRCVATATAHPGVLDGTPIVSLAIRHAPLHITATDNPDTEQLWLLLDHIDTTRLLRILVIALEESIHDAADVGIVPEGER